MSKFKTTGVSTADMLAMASESAENTGEGNVSSIVTANPEVLVSLSQQEVKQTVLDKIPSPIIQTQVQQEENTQEPSKESTVFVQQEPAEVIPQAKTTNAETEQIHAFPDKQKEEMHQNAREYTFSNSTQERKVNIIDVDRVISIADTYRAYEDKIKGTIRKFLKIQDDATIGDVVTSVLKVTSEDRKSMNDLIKLKEEDRPSRAFSLMAMDNSRLEYIQNLVISFNPKYESTSSGDKIAYCKELELGIETLNPSSLVHLKPIDELFSI